MFCSLPAAGRMKPPNRIPACSLQWLLANGKKPTPVPLRQLQNSRAIHGSTVQPAKVAPLIGTGPPPEPPVAEYTAGMDEHFARRRKQAELLRRAKDLRSAAAGKAALGADKKKPLKRRFWEHVSVEVVDGAYQIHLDARPLRHPKTKEMVRIPLSKPNLATALAIEWDHLTSAQQATKQHLIPLASLVCRAIDIKAADDAQLAKRDAGRDSTTISPTRHAIVTTTLRYLDTDSLLCWAPPAGEHDILNAAGESLRDVQRRTADDIVSFLVRYTWPGVVIRPVLDGESIMPQQQLPGVRDILGAWVVGLDEWDLAGFERAVLAGKSFLAAARLVVEWTDGPNGVLLDSNSGKRAEADARLGEERFGAAEMARATNVEVDWQTGRWGEVEDTHDVEKEDLRRQFGGVVLLVSGTNGHKWRSGEAGN